MAPRLATFEEVKLAFDRSKYSSMRPANHPEQPTSTQNRSKPDSSRTRPTLEAPHASEKGHETSAPGFLKLDPSSDQNNFRHKSTIRAVGFGGGQTTCSSAPKGDFNTPKTSAPTIEAPGNDATVAVPTTGSFVKIEPSKPTIKFTCFKDVAAARSQFPIIDQPTKKSSFPAETIDSTDTLRLASLRFIKNIRDVKVANNYLTLAEVDGWTCIVPPGAAYKNGDLILYLGIDAFVPASDKRFGELLPVSTINGKLGHRVQTTKFCSEDARIVAQGYVFPVEKFSEVNGEVEMIREVLRIGGAEKQKPSEDLINLIILAIYRKKNWAEKLGIMKWEEQKFEPKQLPHLKLGTVPTRLFKKTDVTRVEDCPNLFTKAKYHKYLYQESVKMDGTSMTIYFVNSNLPLFANLNPLPEKVGPNTVHPNGRFGVCSKNMDINELSDCQFGYWKIALRYDLPKKLAAKGRSVAIHGEFCGHNINQNREKIRGGQVDFFVFSIYDVTTQKYMNPKIVVGIAQQLGLKHVPVLGYVKIREIADSHHELKKRAMQRKGEGLVYKCLHDGRSFKVISSTYLLEHGL